jgi:glutathione S-transferase
MGNQFTVADAYLYTILRWSSFVDIDLAKWPIVAAYKARVEARPHVRQALLAEGLIKEPAKAAA